MLIYIYIWLLLIDFSFSDIDECSRTSGICSNGVCENMMGTYQCVCDDGYQQTDLKSHCEGNFVSNNQLLHKN